MAWLILMAVLALPGMKLTFREADSHYMEPSSTASVNGFFILLVFLRHVLSYRPFAGTTFLPMQWLDGHTGQLIVVGFLFFSGYGVMEKCRKEGRQYVRSMPSRRIAGTWLRFAGAVILYQILAVCMGECLSGREILLSLLGWVSVGNSNWYIFDILCLYAISWLAAETAGLITGRNDGHRTKDDRPHRESTRDRMTVCLVTLFTIAMILVLARYKEDHWYNTLPAYPAGMFFSLYRDLWERKLREYRRLWPLTAVLIAAAWFILYHQQTNTAAYLAASVLASFSLVFVLRFVKFGNPVLLWLGKHLFGMYMGQRFGMILYQALPVSDGIYLALCAGTAVIFGWFLDEGSRVWADRILSYVRRNQV